MPIMLSVDELQQYERNGFFFPIPVLEQNEAARYLKLSNTLEELLGGKPRAVDLNQMHLNLRWAYDLAVHPKILDMVEDVIGPDILIWATSLFPKHPHDPAYISWHQDGKYWGLDSTQITTAWVALSSSTVENGCMRVVAGSHRKQFLPHVETHAENNMLSRGQEVAVEVVEEEATDIVLRPGEMSLHNVQIIHGSKANTSDEKRVGFAIRYIAPSVKQAGQRPAAILARGTDHYGHFELVTPPAERDMELAVAEQIATARGFQQKVASSYSSQSEEN